MPMTRPRKLPTIRIKSNLTMHTSIRPSHDSDFSREIRDIVSSEMTAGRKRFCPEWVEEAHRLFDTALSWIFRSVFKGFSQVASYVALRHQGNYYPWKTCQIGSKGCCVRSSILGSYGNPFAQIFTHAHTPSIRTHTPSLTTSIHIILGLPFNFNPRRYLNFVDSAQKINISKKIELIQGIFSSCFSQRLADGVCARVICVCAHTTL